MEETAIKDELIEIIEHADLNQLKEIQGLLTNYINGQWVDEDEWDSSLTEYQKSEILKGLEEADAGLGTPFDEATRQIRKKYGLNG
jgi:hypothetical protein